MAKKMKKGQTNTALLLLLFILLIIILSNYKSPLFVVISAEKNFIWNGFQTKAVSSTNFETQANSCAGWGGLIDPITDSNGSISLQAYTAYGQCQGGSGSSGISITVPNPKSYKQIFIKTSGSVSASGSETQNCATSSSTFGLSQINGNSINVYSVSKSCQGSADIPSGVLLLFTDDYVIIPTTQSILKLNGNDDLKFDFALSSSSCCNGRDAKAITTIESIAFTKLPIECSPLYSPVCTTDGITYANQCSAEKIGKSVKYNGECVNQPIIIKPNCLSCPSDTECKTSGEDIICVKTQNQTIVKDISQNRTLIKEVPVTLIKETTKTVEIQKPTFFDSIPTSFKILGGIGIGIIIFFRLIG